MSDEVRRVLDRMVASERAVLTAEQAEWVQFLFDQKPEDMSDEEWARYQQDREEAQSDATNKLYKRMARDERWYKRARSKKQREIQEQVDEVYEAVREQVAKEVEEHPAAKVNRLIRLSVRQAAV